MLRWMTLLLAAAAIIAMLTNPELISRSIAEGSVASTTSPLVTKEQVRSPVSPAQVELPQPERFRPTPKLDLYLRDDYPTLWRHRALAVGPKGVFAAAFREASAKSAIESAQRKCADKLRWHPVKAVRSETCKVIAVDDRIAVADQDEANVALSELPLIWRTDQPLSNTAGILVHVGQCGASSWRNWHDTWVDFFAASNWSFASLPPSAQGQNNGKAARCPSTPWKREVFVDRMRSKLLRAIVQLRHEHAHIPIAVWADGIGGDVAHAARLPDGVSIITTNAACGYGGRLESLMRPSTAITAFVGSNNLSLSFLARDAMVNDISAFCKKARRYLPKLQIHALVSADKFPLWRLDVMRGVAKALSIPSRELRPDPFSELKILPYEAQRTYNRTFRLFAFHRAFVLSQKGQMFFSNHHETKEEAIRAAVYHCQKRNSGNGFRASSGNPCFLFAQNDQILLR